MRPQQRLTKNNFDCAASSLQQPRRRVRQASISSRLRIFTVSSTTWFHGKDGLPQHHRFRSRKGCTSPPSIWICRRGNLYQGGILHTLSSCPTTINERLHFDVCVPESVAKMIPHEVCRTVALEFLAAVVAGVLGSAQADCTHARRTSLLCRHGMAWHLCWSILRYMSQRRCAPRASKPPPVTYASATPSLMH